MRPCDGTSGLVRGNRRKAVFAFKWLFTEGRLARFSLLRTRFYPALPKAPAGSMRQILEPSSTLLFLTKETAGRSVVAFRYAQHSGILPHTSDFFSIPFGYLPIKPCLPLGLR